MKVDLLAHTAIAEYPVPMREAYGYELWRWKEGFTEETDADVLAEAAGRLCYKSFDRPNPATAANADYLANILAQGHYSVLEHASATFLVRDVSRALLTELTRHRHLSFSVVSQRYCDYSKTEPVIPPGADSDAEALIRADYRAALLIYGQLVDTLTRNGLKRKQAREAARCVLPNAAPVDMVVTGNMRAWRDVLGKRWHVAADAEIRALAGAILGHLRSIAPNSFQDVPTEPYGS